MSGQDPAGLHLADLHERAAKRGISGYRLLRREELLRRLEDAGEEPERERDAAAEREEQRPRRRRARRGGRRRRERERLAPEAGESDERDGAIGREDAAERRDEDEEASEVEGVLELTRQRHGFLRLAGLGVRDDDVYVSASQVRRCELRPGDLVCGPARSPRRGERHRALVHVDRVNGGEPQEEGRPQFDALTPAPPSRRIPLRADASLLVRAVDALAPLAFGQRVLVRAAPRSGRTTLLRGLVEALAGSPELDVIVLLIDERPEEAPGWSELVPEGQLALAPADLAPAEHLRIAELALERARRAAEAGRDAVLLCDSLSRLAVAAGGVAEVKRIFGSGRALADAGSLTVVATAFADGEDEGSADRAVRTTETSLVTLDPDLAEQGVVPALRFAECRAVGEEALLSPGEHDALRALRRELAELPPPEAAARLRERWRSGYGR